MDINTEQVCAQIGKHKLLDTRAVKFLDVTIDNNLKFDEHLSLKNFLNITVENRKKIVSFENDCVIFILMRLTSLGEGAFLASVDYPSSDGITIKIPYMVE